MAYIVCDGCKTTLKHNLDTATELLSKTQKALDKVNGTIQSAREFKNSFTGKENE
jgi:hypothetical protein